MPQVSSPNVRRKFGAHMPDQSCEISISRRVHGCSAFMVGLDRATEKSWSLRIWGFPALWFTVQASVDREFQTQKPRSALARLQDFTRRVQPSKAYPDGRGRGACSRGRPKSLDGDRMEFALLGDSPKCSTNVVRICCC